MVGNSLVALLLAFFGVASVSAVPAPGVVTTIDSQAYDRTVDGSSPEYTYAARTLTEAEYASVLSGAFVRSARSGSGILVVQYGDFSSPSSRELHARGLFAHLESSFSGIPLKRADKYFAASATGAAAESARLARCGGSLGGASAYYDTVDALFRGYALAERAGKALSADTVIPQLAKHIGVSRNRIRACMDDEKTAAAVAAAKAEFVSFGFVGTPSVLLINERTRRAVAIAGISPLDYYGTAVALLLADESDSR